MKIYVVTRGSQAAAPIEQLFSTQAAAETYVATRNAARSSALCDIAEWETADDSITPAPVIWGTWVRCNAAGAYSVSAPEPVLSLPADVHERHHGKQYHRIFVPAPTGERDGGKDRATTIARDRIAQWQRDQQLA